MCAVRVPLKSPGNSFKAQVRHCLSGDACAHGYTKRISVCCARKNVWLLKQRTLERQSLGLILVLWWCGGSDAMLWCLGVRRTIGYQQRICNNLTCPTYQALAGFRGGEAAFWIYYYNTVPSAGHMERVQRVKCLVYYGAHDMFLVLKKFYFLHSSDAFVTISNGLIGDSTACSFFF